MVTYQKMLASSSWAIHQSLTRRVAKLRQQLGGRKATTKAPGPQALEELLGEEEPSTVYEALADIEEGQIPDEARKDESARIATTVRRIGRGEDPQAEQPPAAMDTQFEQNPTENP